MFFFCCILMSKYALIFRCALFWMHQTHNTLNYCIFYTRNPIMQTEIRFHRIHTWGSWITKNTHHERMQSRVLFFLVFFFSLSHTKQINLLITAFDHTFDWRKELFLHTSFWFLFSISRIFCFWTRTRKRVVFFFLLLFLKAIRRSRHPNSRDRTTATTYTDIVELAIESLTTD